MPEEYGTLKHVVPVGSDVPAIPKAFKDYDDSIFPLPLTDLATGSKKQIIVCNSSGVPTYVTPSGDLTLSESGDFELGAGVVGSTELADAAGTSRKLKPTNAFRGLVPKSLTTEEEVTLSMTGAEGNTIVITPEVASVMFLYMAVPVSISLNGEKAGTRSGSVEVWPVLDGAVTGFPNMGLGAGFSSTVLGAVGATYESTAWVSQVYRISLTAAKHEIGFRAKRTGGSGGGAPAGQNGTCPYIVVAS